MRNTNQGFPRRIRELAAGEITRNGKPVAKLSPASAFCRPEAAPAWTLERIEKVGALGTSTSIKTTCMTKSSHATSETRFAPDTDILV